MLQTPLGMIKIYVDGISIDYEASEMVFDRPPCKDNPIDGCYRITVDTKKCCSINCVIEALESGLSNTGDSGERYINSEFIKDNVVLTIGMEDENPAFESVRIPLGLQCNIISVVDKIIFGVAWTENYEGIDDVRTWFAADPTIE